MHGRSGVSLTFLAPAFSLARSVRLKRLRKNTSLLPPGFPPYSFQCGYRSAGSAAPPKIAIFPQPVKPCPSQFRALSNSGFGRFCLAAEVSHRSVV